MRGSLTGNFVRKTGDTMTGRLTLSVAGDVPLVIDHLTAGQQQMISFRKSGAARYLMVAADVEPHIRIGDSGGIIRISAQGTDGKHTAGIVPLARMGTVLLDTSTSVLANTNSNITIEAGADVHKFYVGSRYIAGAVDCIEGVDVTAAEVVSVTVHTSIKRNGAGGSNFLNLINGTATTRTVVYKIYSLTET